jgi:hypothetical protein
MARGRGQRVHHHPVIRAAEPGAEEGAAGGGGAGPQQDQELHAGRRPWLCIGAGLRAVHVHPPEAWPVVRKGPIQLPGLGGRILICLKLPPPFNAAIFSNPLIFYIMNWDDIEQEVYVFCFLPGCHFWLASNPFLPCRRQVIMAADGPAYSYQWVQIVLPGNEMARKCNCSPAVSAASY